MKGEEEGSAMNERYILQAKLRFPAPRTKGRLSFKDSPLALAAR
jgi:hypothetical protein